MWEQQPDTFWQEQCWDTALPLQGLWGLSGDGAQAPGLDPRKTGTGRQDLPRAQQHPLYRKNLWGEPCDGSKLVKKKARSLSPFKETIQSAKPEDTLEVDEVFTFIRLRVNQVRIWIVECRRTRQILSFFIGDGSMKSCKRLWRKLPTPYLYCFSFSDFWAAYNCIPEVTHEKVGKGAGQTCHIERLNNTIRQRFSRMVRKALSFSKREYMLNLHFKLFAWHYNLFVAPRVAAKLNTNC
jgi:IS1 family transposase